MTTSMDEVSDVARKDVWELLVNLERNVRYYSLIGDRHGLNYRLIRFGVLSGLLFEGLVLYFAVNGSPNWWVVGGILAFVLALMTVFDVVTNYADSAAVLKFTAIMCDDLKSEVEQLWTRIETEQISSLRLEEQYSSIVERWSRATQKATLSLENTPNHDTTVEAVKVLRNRYGQ